MKIIRTALSALFLVSLAFIFGAIALNLAIGHEFSFASHLIAGTALILSAATLSFDQMLSDNKNPRAAKFVLTVLEVAVTGIAIAMLYALLNMSWGMTGMAFWSAPLLAYALYGLPVRMFSDELSTQTT